MDKAKIYFDTSAIGLLSDELIEVGNKFSRELAENGSQRTAIWSEADYPRIKSKLADFLGAKTDEVAFIPNFSFGLSAFLTSLPNNLKVATLPSDYPSLTLPIELLGFNKVEIAIEDEVWPTEDEIIEGLKELKPAVFVVSHVQFQSGFKLNYELVGEFCQANKILFILDVTQSLGYEKYDFSNGLIDVLLTSHYKWMNAGAGTGSMTIKKAVLDKFKPKMGGFISVQFKNGKMVYHPSIKSYEPGHFNMRGLLELEQAIIEKSIELKENCLKYQMKLVHYFLEKIKEHQLKLVGSFAMINRSPIVCIWDESGELYQKISTKNIICTYRNGRIRFGFSPKNTFEEIEEIFKVI